MENSPAVSVATKTQVATGRCTTSVDSAGGKTYWCVETGGCVSGMPTTKNYGTCKVGAGDCPTCSGAGYTVLEN